MDATRAVVLDATRRQPPDALRVFALHDVIVLGYLLVALGLVLRSSGPARTACAIDLSACAAALVAACALGRGGRGGWSWRDVAYRAVVVAVVLRNYLMLRPLLPLVRSDSVDGALYALDLALFGVEPALWLERLSTPAVVEYFAFFYFSYFAVCGCWLVAIVWLVEPGRHTSEFAIGTALVLCIGQLGYFAVPGYGPVRHLADSFAGPLHGGFFWTLVTRTVESGGALKDIFPSLHTALPVWLAAFALRRARESRRWLAAGLVTAFFASMIVVSTMLLRWHWAVDVVAGLALAAVAALVAPWLARYDETVRTARGWVAAWRHPASGIQPNHERVLGAE